VRSTFASDSGNTEAMNTGSYDECADLYDAGLIAEATGLDASPGMIEKARTRRHHPKTSFPSKSPRTKPS